MTSPPPGGPPRSMEGVLLSRTVADSSRTQRHALAAIGELQALRQGSPQEQDLAWYYLQFGLGWVHTVKWEGQPVTRGRWVTPREVGHHLGIGSDGPHVLSITPAGAWVPWAVVDVDTKSRYHPGSEEGEGIEPVKIALTAIGLLEPLEIQSSHSDGVHLWYPLDRPTHALTIARAMRAACFAAGLQVADGVLEFRPNDKASGSNFATIRAPLTGEGNAIWVPGVGLVEELSLLRYLWEQAQGSNQLTPLDHSLNRRGQLPPRSQQPGRCLQGARDRLTEGFTGPGQTEALKLAALQVAGLLEGLSDPEVIRRRCVELVSGAPGFYHHCRHRREVESGRAWGSRSLAMAAAMTPGGYRGTWKERANKKAADHATERALAAIEAARATGIRYRSDKAATDAMQAQGAPARSWWHKPANAAALASLRELVGPREREAPRSAQKAA